jgi:hypothetical protein
MTLNESITTPLYIKYNSGNVSPYLIIGLPGIYILQYKLDKTSHINS